MMTMAFTRSLKSCALAAILGLQALAVLPKAIAQTADVPAELSSAGFVNSYSILTPLKRARMARMICTQVLQMPVDAYKNEITAMGRMYAGQPEAVDFLIGTCHNIWGAVELDPKQSTKIGRAQKIAAYDLLEAGKSALPVRIRQYMEAPAVGTTRPAPLEILTGMSSSERDLDQTLQANVASAVAALTAAGSSGIITTLEMTGVLARTSSKWGLRASATGLEVALAVTVLSGAVAVGTDYLVWWKRESDAWSRVSDIMNRLENRTADQPLAPLLDEYYRITEQLGYFYSYSLLQADKNNGMPEANKKCFKKLDDFFMKPGQDWASKYKKQKVCGDAAAVFIGASHYLRAILPNEPMAEAISDRLITRAKRTFWSYNETAAWRATLPVCTPKIGPSIFQVYYECVDPKTGGIVL